MMDCWDYGLPTIQESFLDSFPATEASLMTTDHLYTPPPLPPPPMYYHNHSPSSSMDPTFPNTHLLSPECKYVQDTANMFNTEYVSGNNELSAVVWNNQFNKGHQNQHQLMEKKQEDVMNIENAGLLKVDEAGEKKSLRNKQTMKNEQLSMPKLLTRKIISQFFYMPITQAAKELNIGLTLLKKRCRELGILHWPHRKLMGLQTLINNVQELGKQEGEGSGEKLKMAVEVLERERGRGS